MSPPFCCCCCLFWFEQQSNNKNSRKKQQTTRNVPLDLKIGYIVVISRLFLTGCPLFLIVASSLTFRYRNSTIACNQLHFNSLRSNMAIKSNKTATKVSKSELFWLSHSTKIIKNSKGCTTRPLQCTERTAVALLLSLHSRPAHLHSNAWASLLFVSCARARKPLCCRDSVYIR